MSEYKCSSPISDHYIFEGEKFCYSMGSIPCDGRRVHYGIDIDYDWALLGACFYTAWYHGNIDYKLKYLWDNNTEDKTKVTCKRCLGMLRTDLRSLD